MSKHQPIRFILSVENERADGICERPGIPDFVHCPKNEQKYCTIIVVVVVVSHTQRIGCQPEKLFYTVANPARRLLTRDTGSSYGRYQGT